MEGCIVKTITYDEIKIITEDGSFPYWKMKDGTIFNHHDFEILWHPVEWHHVFAKLLEQKNIVQLFWKRIKVLREYDAIREINNYILDIEIDATISPMEQPLLIEELLKLNNRNMEEILKLIAEWATPRIIEFRLNIPIHRIRKVLAEAKLLWYTTIYSYGWSGCTCKFNESVNWCECDWSPFVWRQTVMTEKWMEYLKSITIWTLKNQEHDISELTEK